MFIIQDELKKLPESPGVYLHKDEFGQIIYVGKAVNLSRRVRQYFQSPANQPPKVRRMVEHIAEFEYISTGSEMEALILECNLIKKHTPKYNILLRDDKTYPYIKVTLKEEFPRILKTRRIVNDGSRYFGPYADAGAVNTIIDLLNSVYALKRCPAADFPEGFRPCLNYHIHQCRGICRGDVAKADYMASLGKALEFLHGRDKELMQLLSERMKACSEAMDYEQAAAYRDYIKAVETMAQKQRVVLSRPEDIDIILICKGLSGAHAVLFTVREGKLSGRESFFLGDLHPGRSEEQAAEFIKQYYYASVLIPREILLTKRPADAELLEDWLSGQRGGRVALTAPERGEKRALMDLVRKDVDEMVKDLDERARRQLEKEEAVREGLRAVFGLELADKLHRIEAYDISNINGVDSVGGMVVFLDGRPQRKDYRRFRIKTIEGPDDTGSLQEMLFRRFKEARNGAPGFSLLPDLILMDGGENQINAAKAVLSALDFDIPVAGAVKDEKHRTRAILYEGREILLKEHQKLYAYIGSIQEEVHRFAIDYHRKLRGKALSRSVLDNIRGIGEKRKRALLADFGSVEAIKSASLYELAQVDGMNSSAAEAVAEYFKKGKASTEVDDGGA